MTSTLPFMNRGLQQQMEHLDPRKRMSKFSSSTNEAITVAWNKRRSRCEAVGIQHIGSIDLIETSKVHLPSSNRMAWIRPAIVYSHSQGSTISRSSSSGSSDSEAIAAKRAHEFKLPKLRRKPVPAYLDEENPLSVLTIEDHNQISVVFLEQDRSPSSASATSDQSSSSPKDCDSSGSFSHDHSTRRSSISSVHSALSLSNHNTSQSSLASHVEDKKIPTHPSLQRSSSFTLNDHASVDSIAIQKHCDAGVVTVSTPLSPTRSPARSPMSKRKPVPYFILVEEPLPTSTSDIFVSGNMLGLSGESEGDEVVIQKVATVAASKKVIKKKSSKPSKKSILISAAIASEEQKQPKKQAPPRPSRRERALRSGESSPVLSECSFHTAGTEDEDDHEEEQEATEPTAELPAPLPLPGCFPHHSARVFVSKNKRGKSKYYVVPPRRADSSLLG